MADYATLVEATYADALAEAEAEAEALHEALHTFTEEPSEGQSFEAAKEPIDNDEDGPEGQINAWPIDESYID